MEHKRQKSNWFTILERDISCWWHLTKIIFLTIANQISKAYMANFRVSSYKPKPCRPKCDLSHDTDRWIYFQRPVSAWIKLWIYITDILCCSGIQPSLLREEHRPDVREWQELNLGAWYTITIVATVPSLLALFLITVFVTLFLSPEEGSIFN